MKERASAVYVPYHIYIYIVITCDCVYIYIKNNSIHNDLNINNLIPNSLTYHTQYPQYKLHRLMWLEFEKTLELHNYNHVTLTVSGCLVLIIIYSLISYCKTKCKTIKSTHRCRFESYLSQLYYYYYYHYY